MKLNGVREAAEAATGRSPAAREGLCAVLDAAPAREAALRPRLRTERDIAAAAWGLARQGSLARLSDAESRLLADVELVDPSSSRSVLTELVRQGGDPLGEAFARVRPAAQRRLLGATYTPVEIVASMVGWIAGNHAPSRVVDPGTGSARFLLAAGRALSHASLVGVEVDPLAALIARANLTAAGLDHRSRIVVADYRTADLGGCDGVTAYVGNPPYVRHHQIDAAGKRWLAESAARLGRRANGLAGLHAHFMLATALHARPGDVGSFVTSAEWLDVNYGKLLRELLAAELGGVSLHVIDPEATPFSDAATTAAVTCFEIGTTRPSIRVKRVCGIEALGVLDDGERLDRESLREAPRWTPLIDGTPKPPDGYVELGELCRVHRGAVTGANKTWITEASDPALPSSVLFPTVTRALQLFGAPAGVLMTTRDLRAVVDLPPDLGTLDGRDRSRVEEFLRAARRDGAHEGYVARHRNPWWSVRLREPAPILATYMARRPPTFVRNMAGARNINVAHGIYPREPMSEMMLDALAEALRVAAPDAVGRTYAGGLLKFEPSEMSRIHVPALDMLEASAARTTPRPASVGLAVPDESATLEAPAA